MVTKGKDSSTKEETFLPQPVRTEENCLKLSPGVGRQMGVWTLSQMSSLDLETCVSSPDVNGAVRLYQRHVYEITPHQSGGFEAPEMSP